MSYIRHLTRAWYYLRVGYSIYLAFILSIANTLVVLYYLLVQNIPLLQSLFPHFIIFALIGVAIGIPAGVAAGWLHMKGTPAWTSEVDIGIEANPYYYKLAPGHQKEVFAPINLEILRLLRKLAEDQGILTEEEKAHLKELEEKMDILLKGGYVGAPRRRGMS